MGIGFGISLVYLQPFVDLQVAISGRGVSYLRAKVLLSAPISHVLDPRHIGAFCKEGVVAYPCSRLF